MNKLSTFIKAKQEKQEKLLSIYLTAGFPTIDATLSLLEAIVDGGADMIELGVPFSDPQADGPTIQAASQQALSAGITLEKTLNILAEFKKRYDTPALLMGYANPFYQYGWEKLAENAAITGAAGFIIPDLPPEESEGVREIFASRDLALIQFVSPNTPEDRIKTIDAIASGFIYAVSITGITGARSQLPPETAQFLERLREQISHPALVGFGVSNPETAAAMCRYSDGVIIGSAVIKRIAEADNLEQAGKSIREFLEQIKEVI